MIPRTHHGKVEHAVVILERCQSGRMEHTANVLSGKPFRGFESLPLRNDSKNAPRLREGFEGERRRLRQQVERRERGQAEFCFDGNKMSA